MCIAMLLYTVWSVFMSARIIMIGCRKGGVTKTTTTVNLSYELSCLGKRVLTLDFDGQGDTTKFFGREDAEFYIGDALLDRKFDIKKSISRRKQTIRENEIFLSLSHHSLAHTKTQLTSK